MGKAHAKKTAGLLQLNDTDPQKDIVVDYKNTYEEATGEPVSTFGGHAYDGLIGFGRAF